MRREKQLNFAIPEEWHDWLRRRSFEERVPIADLVRQALKTAYPDLPEPKPDRGRKGGAIYPTGGLPASLTCDRPD